MYPYCVVPLTHDSLNSGDLIKKVYYSLHIVHDEHGYAIKMSGSVQEPDVIIADLDGLTVMHCFQYLNAHLETLPYRQNMQHPPFCQMML